MSVEANIRYYPDTDSMAIELRPWPGSAAANPAAIGGEDRGPTS